MTVHDDAKRYAEVALALEQELVKARFQRRVTDEHNEMLLKQLMETVAERDALKAERDQYRIENELMKAKGN